MNADPTSTGLRGAVVFIAIPAALIAVDLLLFGREWSSLFDDVHSTFYEWARLLVRGETVQLFRHMPGTPVIEFFALFAIAEIFFPITYEDLNTGGIVLYVLLLTLAARMVAKCSAELQFDPLDLVVVAAWAFTMPVMIRYMSMFSIYYIFGLFMVVAGFYFCVTWQSGFKRHWNTVFFLVGAASTFLYFAVVPFIAVLIVYLARLNRHGKAALIEDAVLSGRPVWHVVAFLSAVVIISGYVQHFVNQAYAGFGSMKAALMLFGALGIAGAMFISRLNLRQVAIDATIAFGVQIAVFALSFAFSDSLANLHYAGSVAAAFSVVIVSLSLWRHTWFKMVLAGPLGLFALGTGLFANIYAPFLGYGAFLAMGPYADFYLSIAPEAGFMNFLGRDGWNVSLIAMATGGLAAAALLFHNRTLANGGGRRALILIMFSAAIVFVDIWIFYDLLTLKLNEEAKWHGMMSRYLLPTLFCLPLIVTALKSFGNRVRLPALSGILAVSAYSYWDYVQTAVPLFWTALQAH